MKRKKKQNYIKRSITKIIFYIFGNKLNQI
ncbi:unnamed protein product, partial [Vitis vinifera]|uniref:Uncharacterized protein n=1 Tax=Vitis vinifera TaxID=29760 RepID=D7TUV7_VITVI